jgi:DNA-binding HxlR family transcriptional regulator
MKGKETNCPAEYTLSLIHGRWKIPLIFHLLNGAKRFSELARALSGVTQKMLTQQLREMERDGLVERKVFPEVPPRVEYSLTPLGKSLEAIVESMCRWGLAHGASSVAGRAQA